MKNDQTVIAGKGTLSQGEYHKIAIEGIRKSKGTIRFDELRVDGKYQSEGMLEGGKLRVDGMVKCTSGMKVKELCVNGLVQVSEGNVYSDAIKVDGVLKCSSEISADTIQVNGYIKASLLTGDRIVLNYSEAHKVFRLLPKRNVQHVERVECTCLEASMFTCAHICAQEIHLRDGCNIDFIECDGTISMDDTCHVRKISGNYKMV